MISKGEACQANCCFFIVGLFAPLWDCQFQKQFHLSERVQATINYKIMRKLSQLNYHHHQLEKNGLVLSPPTSFFSKCNYFKIDKWWNWGQIDLYMIFFSQLESIFFLWTSFHSCKSHRHCTRIMTKCILNRCQTVKFTANKRLCASVSSLSLFLRIFLTTVSIGLFSKGQNTIL